MGQRRFVLLFFFLAACITVIVQCTQIQKTNDNRGPAYAGSSTCIKCHKDISGNYAHNAHFKTSRYLRTATSTDSLNLPASEFIFNKNTRVGVEKRNGGLFQVAYINGKEVKAERTDFVFGAGLSAYTFGFWYGNKMMQMPLNYLIKAHQWANSPGFPTEQIYFGRPIISRCLECHSSYVEKTMIQTAGTNAEEEFTEGSIIAGIDCERCHGPAASHVTFHEENPLVKKAHDMVSYRALARERRIDMCGVCHSGIQLQTIGSTFAFKPGDTLKSLPQYSQYNGGEPDVHGNQKQLLQASACYKLGKLECISCHDIHGAEKTGIQPYVQKCLSCHQNPDHKTLKNTSKAMLNNKCIDCHMPLKESSVIGFQVSNSKDKIPYRIRTHRIAVYKDLIRSN